MPSSILVIRLRSSRRSFSILSIHKMYLPKSYWALLSKTGIEFCWDSCLGLSPSYILSFWSSAKGSSSWLCFWHWGLRSYSSLGILKGSPPTLLLLFLKLYSLINPYENIPCSKLFVLLTWKEDSLVMGSFDFLSEGGGKSWSHCFNDPIFSFKPRELIIL